MDRTDRRLITGGLEVRKPSGQREESETGGAAGDC